jgi:hypothetical protein
MPDQWAFLATVRPMSLADMESTILRATGGAHPLDVAFITEEDEHEPWKRRPIPKKLAGPLPAKLTAVLANQIYFEKSQLPQALMNRLIRLAAFQNPEFYRAQAMRRSTWEFPRVIGSAENYPRHIALPRGCLDAATKLLDENGIGLDLTDERFSGESLSLKFAGQLRPRPGEGGQSHDGPRHRRPLRAYRFRQDRHGGGTDCPARRQHTDSRPPAMNYSSSGRNGCAFSLDWTKTCSAPSVAASASRRG